MAIKRIRISDDNGATYHTLPGATGDMRRELSTTNDTVFGQAYQSGDVSIGMWMVSGQAFFKNVAGYTARLRRGGTPTSMTAEATTLVSGKTYQITAAARRVISLTHPLTVLVSAVDQTANVISVDYLNGTVTFAPSYTVTGAVTITGHFVPLVTLAKARTFSLTQTAQEIDTIDYETAQANTGWRTYIQGLRTVALELGGIYAASEAIQDALTSRSIFYVDISPNNNDNTFLRGFFKRTSFSQSGDVGALEEATQNFVLWVPDGDLVSFPFKWYFAGNTPLNIAVRKCLDAWQSGDTIKVQYLPDGVAGYGGDAIITECSLTNQLDGLNEFRFSFRGSGLPATV